jgi:imidazolonepropionase
MIIKAEILKNGNSIRLYFDRFGEKEFGIFQIYPEPYEYPLPKISKIDIISWGNSILVKFENGIETIIPSGKFLPPQKGDLLVQNIGELLTFKDNSLGLIKNGAFIIGNGEILEAGKQKDILNSPLLNNDIKVVDAMGKVVSPGLVDPHTHPVFGGDRSAEFVMRVNGADYLEIMAAGGGIQNSVKNTRESSLEQLEELAAGRILRSLSYGVTSIEAKSGYALNEEGELKSLRVLRNLSSSLPVDISASLLAAHIIPSEYKENRQDYINLIINNILPKVVLQNLADSCDVFCEEGAFTLDETRTILEKAKNLGLSTRIHAGQFNSLGAVKLAAQIGSLSCDHLEEVSDEEMEYLADSNTIATFLPGAALTLGMEFPQVKKFTDRGINCALGTDLNPGTSMTENLPLMATLGCLQMGMSVEEVWRGITINSAKAAGFNDRGILKKGFKGDFVIWDFDHYGMLPYHFGVNLVKQVFKNGRNIL